MEYDGLFTAITRHLFITAMGKSVWVETPIGGCVIDSRGGHGREGDRKVLLQGHQYIVTHGSLISLNGIDHPINKHLTHSFIGTLKNLPSLLYSLDRERGSGEDIHEAKEAESTAKDFQSRVITLHRASLIWGELLMSTKLDRRKFPIKWGLQRVESLCRRCS
jgi:hypothetical protein